MTNLSQQQTLIRAAVDRLADEENSEMVIALLESLQRRTAASYCWMCRCASGLECDPDFETNAAFRDVTGHWMHEHINWQGKPILLCCHAEKIWNLPLLVEEALPL